MNSSKPCKNSSLHQVNMIRYDDIIVKLALITAIKNYFGKQHKKHYKFAIRSFSAFSSVFMLYCSSEYEKHRIWCSIIGRYVSYSLALVPVTLEILL